MGLSPIALLVSLPAALVGGWYLVNPNAAATLSAAEGPEANRTRVRLRRVNGLVMLLAGCVLYFAVSRTIALSDGGRAGLALPIAWIALVPLTVVMLVLAYLDMRLTRRLRRRGLEGVVKGTAAVLLAVALVSCDDAEQRAEAPTLDPPAGIEEDDAPQPQMLPTVTMQFGDEAFELMIADDKAEQQTGLMHRQPEDLGENEGMLFVFDDEDWRGFWMKDTPAPLDIVYVAADGTVVNVRRGTPFSERMVHSAGPAKYVIEVAQGRAEAVGVGRGTKLTIPALPAE